MATDDASAQANRSAMDPRRLVVIFYLVATIISGLFFEHMLGQIWAQLGLPDPVILPGPDWHLTTVLGFVVAAACAVGCWIHPRTKSLSLECASELMKVTWPTWAETRVSTIAVIGASIVASLVLFVIDQAAYHVMVEWLPRLWGKF
jgi:preprotein translocase subunit SecE